MHLQQECPTSGASSSERPPWRHMRVIYLRIAEGATNHLAHVVELVSARFCVINFPFLISLVIHRETFRENASTASHQLTPTDFSTTDEF